MIDHHAFFHCVRCNDANRNLKTLEEFHRDFKLDTDAQVFVGLSFPQLITLSEN